MRRSTVPALASALLALGAVFAPTQAAEQEAEPTIKRVVITNKSGSLAAGSLGTRVSIAPRRAPATGDEATKSD